ncbi:MAG: GerMN domain-containing protein [Acidobacteriia bacterium]|nr:GerMN domain-containing protein [Terriglobia bacterium]
MSLRAKIFLLILLVVLGAATFYLRSLAKRVFIEPTRHAEETARAKLSEFALQSKKGSSQTATLYFPSLEQGKLVPEGYSITWAEANVDRVRQVVLALAEGSHQGLRRVLPASTSVRAVFLAPDGTAYVDLSNDVLSEFPPGIETESLAIYSLVNSITMNIPSVKKVQFLIQGQEVETLDGHADLTAPFAPDPTGIKSGS